MTCQRLFFEDAARHASPASLNIFVLGEAANLTVNRVKIEGVLQRQFADPRCDSAQLYTQPLPESGATVGSITGLDLPERQMDSTRAIKTMWANFLETVGRHFGFLETELGFVLKSIKPPVVIFESDKLQVLILYDVTRGHELALGLRRLADDPRKPLSLGVEMLMEFKEGRRTDNYRTPFPTTSEALETEVARLAELVRNYGADVLKGDLRAFDWLQQREQELAQKFVAPSQRNPTP